MIKVKSRKSGVTLIEVVISIAILSIAVPPMLSMVLSSVKTNKAGEDKQKALYIAQKYVEEFKASSSIPSATNEFIDVPEAEFSGFQYKKTISELDYKFPNKGDKPKFTDIKYDATVVLDSNENNILIDIRDKSGSINIGNTSFDKSLSDKITLEIINGKDKDDKANENKVIIKLNGTTYDIDKQIDNLGKKSGYVIIQFKGTGDNNSQDNLPKIGVKASNYCNDEFTIYFANEIGPKVRYSFENNIGKVKIHSNILIEGKPYTNNSRVYRIDVEVRKKDGESLQKVTAYKNVAE